MPTTKGRFKVAIGKMGKMVRKMVGVSTEKINSQNRQAKEQSSSSQHSSPHSLPKSKQNNEEDDDSFSQLRAPDQPKKEVLVRDTPSFFKGNLYSQARRLKMKQQQLQKQNLSPDGNSQSSFDAYTPADKQTTLFFDRLFRPPVELLFEADEKGSSNVFEAAKKVAVEQGKWLLMNLQRCNNHQFASLTLNRDLWSEHSVQAMIKAKFVFLQLEIEEGGGEENGSLGQQLAGFYHVTETPFVALLDPRTGEKMIGWSAGSQQLSNANDWLKEVSSFLDALEGRKSSKKEKVSKDGGKAVINISSTTTTAKFIDAHAMSEEEQLQAAIEASLIETQVTPVVMKKKKSITASTSSWKEYLGPEDNHQKPLQFVIRLPDGTRRPVTFPAGSKVKALQLYLEQEFGLKESSYELVTLLPKKCIHLDGSNIEATLEAAGFKHRDTFYLQLK